MHNYNLRQTNYYDMNKIPNSFSLCSSSQEFSEDYHAKKSLDATVSENVTGSIIGGRTLMRSNSIQDELLTTF